MSLCSDQIKGRRDNSEYLFMKEQDYSLSVNMEMQKDVLFYMSKKSYELMWWAVSVLTERTSTYHMDRKNFETEVNKYCQRFKWLLPRIALKGEEIFLIPFTEHKAFQDSDNNRHGDIIFEIRKEKQNNIVFKVYNQFKYERKEHCEECSIALFKEQKKSCKYCQYYSLYKKTTTSKKEKNSIRCRIHALDKWRRKKVVCTAQIKNKINLGQSLL